MELLVVDLCLPGDPWQRGRDTASFELPGRIERAQKGKARKYDVLRLPRQRETCCFPPSGCLHRCFGAPPARKMACSGMRVVWGQGCALDETSGRDACGVGGTGMEIRNAQNAVQVRYHCFCAAGWLMVS